MILCWSDKFRMTIKGNTRSTCHLKILQARPKDSFSLATIASLPRTGRVRCCCECTTDELGELLACSALLEVVFWSQVKKKSNKISQAFSPECAQASYFILYLMFSCCTRFDEYVVALLTLCRLIPCVDKLKFWTCVSQNDYKLIREKETIYLSIPESDWCFGRIHFISGGGSPHLCWNVIWNCGWGVLVQFFNLTFYTPYSTLPKKYTFKRYT